MSSLRVVLSALVLVGALLAADFKAGVARLRITPEPPIWLSGYASRTRPADGVIQDLWAKALALEDPRGGRAVIVTTDLIGLPRGISELVAARVQKQYGLDRARLLLNSSHTHTGPVLRENLQIMYEISDEQWRRIHEYSQKLTDDLVNLVGAALADLKPARVAYAAGKAGFAINRREFAKGGVKIGVNERGPMDHEVPVVRVTAPDGTLRAVLFAYACHNTTLTGEFYKLSGDYAGFAQAELEKAHPGATALFLMLCGADQNPNPRSTLELAEQHGKTLAAEVSRVLSGKLKRVRPPVRAAFKVIEPEFAPHTRETFEQRLKETNHARVRHARYMLRLYEEGRPIRRVPYPVQAIRLDNDLTIVALGGEVVVDYALRAKHDFGNAKEPIIVAGYSNDVMSYVPSLRVLKEGGYEADSSMLYYGLPGPFSEQIEETIFDAIGDVLRQVGRKPAR